MKKFLLTLLASLSLLTAAGTLFALPTFAEGEDTAKTTWLQISPTAVSLTLEAGQDINPGDDACPNEIDAGCAVEVTNSGTQPFTFRVYASPYVVTGEDYSLSFSEDASTSYTQIYRWISFQDLDGSYVSAIQRQINPGETVTIPWKVDVPEDLPGGSLCIFRHIHTRAASGNNRVIHLSGADILEECVFFIDILAFKGKHALCDLLVCVVL